MQKLDIKKAKSVLENKISDQLSGLKNILNSPGNSLTEKIELLRSVRSAVYEDLNQFQHENLIIKVATELQQDFRKVDQWKWHPNQTGGKSEADLQGYMNGKIILSAEITTSLRPIGAIDKRMRTTLEKLDELEGNKFYIVQTEAMAQRARSKINNFNFDITVLQL